MFLNKELCTNGISLRVETGITLLDEDHLIDETVKFSLALFWNAELVFCEETCIPMPCHKVITDRRFFHVQQYVDEGVKPYSRHSLNHTDNM